MFLIEKIFRNIWEYRKYISKTSIIGKIFTHDNNEVKHFILVWNLLLLPFVLTINAFVLLMAHIYLNG